MRRISFALAASGLLLVSSTVHAQAPEIDLGAGPGWNFTPAITVGWVWDDNVALVNEGFQQDIRADHLLVIRPAGDFAYRGKFTDLRGGYTGTFRRYRDLGTLDSFDQRLRASLSHRVSPRLSFFGRYGFAALPTTEETELNGVPFRRLGTKVNDGTGGLEIRLDKFTTLRGSYDVVRADFEQEQPRPTDVIGGLTHGFNTELSRRLTERLDIGGLYELRMASVKMASSPDEPLTYQIGGGLVGFRLAPHTHLTLAGGLSTLTDRRLPGTSVGPFIRANLRHALERAVISARYERAFVPTYGFGASAMSEHASASLLMPIARNRAYVQSSTIWRRNNPELEAEPSLQSFWLSTTVGYRIARPIRIEGFYIVAWQDTRLAGGRVNRQRVGAQIALSAPMRIH
jgi:hypothetical protein